MGWKVGVFLFNFVRVVLFSFVCRDIGGKPVSLCYRCDDTHDFLLVGVGAFRVDETRWEYNSCGDNV
jgi:hypothetical protein